MLSEDEALKPAMTMMGHISNHIAQIVANEIADMTGKNVTLMRLFKDMPKLYDYFTNSRTFSHKWWTELLTKKSKTAHYS